MLEKKDMHVYIFIYSIYYYRCMSSSSEKQGKKGTRVLRQKGRPIETFQTATDVRRARQISLFIFASASNRLPKDQNTERTRAPLGRAPYFASWFLAGYHGAGVCPYIPYMKFAHAISLLHVPSLSLSLYVCVCVYAWSSKSG